MARTIRDVALGYSILKGPDGLDGYAIHARDAQGDDGGLAGQPIRVGWVSDAAFAPVDPEITAAVAAAAAQLADLGCAVEEVTLPFLGDPFGALATLVYAFHQSARRRPGKRSACGRGRHPWDVGSLLH